MDSKEFDERDVFQIKIVQSGKIKRISITDEHLDTKFYDFYYMILKELKLKKREVFLSNDDGKALSNRDLNSPLSKIIEKFGKKLNLYSDKIL